VSSDSLYIDDETAGFPPEKVAGFRIAGLFRLLHFL